MYKKSVPAVAAVPPSTVAPKPARAPVGPPMPTFRPIVLTNGIASETAATKGSSVGPQTTLAIDLEEGEVPASIEAPPVASTSAAPAGGALTAARMTSPDAELSPPLPPSDVRSGDQNNHNDSDSLGREGDVAPGQEQASTRKRTRSPDLAADDGSGDGRPLQRLMTAVGPS